MARSDAFESGLRRARGAYERAHVVGGLRGVAIAGVLSALAFGLHRTADVTWLFAATLAATLGALGWRGGAWRRGAIAGVLAGLPPLIMPSLVFALGHGGHCASCAQDGSWLCLLTCLGTSALVGLVVGHHATLDAAPRRFAIAAISTGALTGLLGCGTTGLGGALGIVVGLLAGGVTGWVVADRTARA